MKLAIAFGSGGTRGLASLGVMTALLKEGIKPVAVAGSSVGGLIAAYYGIHGETESLRAWWEKQKSKAIFSYVSKGKFKHSLMEHGKMETIIKEFIKDGSFKDTIVPVTIVTTDLFKGKTKFFRKGRLLEPVMASGTIPGLFPPIKIKNRYYVDGGVTDPTPIDAFKGMDVHVLGIDFTTTKAKKPHKPTITESIFLAYDGSRKSIIEHQKGYHDCTIIHPSKGNTDLLSLEHIKKHTRNGERAGRALIRKWKKEGLL